MRILKFIFKGPMPTHLDNIFEELTATDKSSILSSLLFGALRLLLARARALCEFQFLEARSPHIVGSCIILSDPRIAAKMINKS